MCANFLGEVVPNRSECKMKNRSFKCKFFFKILPHKCEKTGHIPKPGAPDDLRGHQVQNVHACRTYVR